MPDQPVEQVPDVSGVMLLRARFPVLFLVAANQ